MGALLRNGLRETQSQHYSVLEYHRATKMILLRFRESYTNPELCTPKCTLDEDPGVFCAGQGAARLPVKQPGWMLLGHGHLLCLAPAPARSCWINEPEEKHLKRSLFLSKMFLSITLGSFCLSRCYDHWSAM